MTRGSFIENLCNAFGIGKDGIFERGMERGWLEYEDELYCDLSINRKNIARILHMFLLKEMGISDIPDIHRAGVLRDLYDCRVCANHVAQVYLRGIMDARDLAGDGGFLWFDLENEDQDIEKYIFRTSELVKNNMTSNGQG